MAISDFALALAALLGTLLLPFAVLYRFLRFKRRTVAVQVPAAPQKDQV